MKAMPVTGEMLDTSSENASRPPAEAPTPTAIKLSFSRRVVELASDVGSGSPWPFMFCYFLYGRISARWQSADHLGMNFTDGTRKLYQDFD
jgi:hypothetical protein